MAMTYLALFPSTSNRALSSSYSLSPKLTAAHPPSPLLHFSKIPKRPSLAVHSKGSDDSADAPDRLISAIVYFYPFFDGVQYGKYVITQFYPFQAFIQPLVPAIRVFKSFPFNGFLVFLTLYFVVVRNPNFSRYVRFNTMQAIVLDVLLIFPDLLERTFNPRDGVGLDVLMSLDSTVFLFLLVSLIYGSSSCLLGQLPRLPIVADAADRQADEYAYPQCRAPEKRFARYDVNTGKASGGVSLPIGVIIGLLVGVGGVGACFWPSVVGVYTIAFQFCCLNSEISIQTWWIWFFKECRWIYAVD